MNAKDEEVDTDFVYIWCLILNASDGPGGTCSIKCIATDDNPAEEHSQQILLPSGLVGNYSRVVALVGKRLFVKIRTDYVKRKRELVMYLDDEQAQIVKDYCK